jgi:hypothetical protein
VQLRHFRTQFLLERLQLSPRLKIAAAPIAASALDVCLVIAMNARMREKHS